MLLCINEWTKWLDKNQLVDSCYLNLAKAFDSVSHSKLEYGSQIWSPYQLDDIDLIESVQHEFTTGCPKSHSPTLSANNSAPAHLFAMRFFALNQAQFNLEFLFYIFYFDQNDAFYGYFTKVLHFGSSFW